MKSTRFAGSLKRSSSLFWGMQVGLAVLLAIAVQSALAQTQYGALTNFDVFNDTNQECHGFEIELHGISSANVTSTFGGNFIRYGNPKVVDFPGGVYVRYESPYDRVKQVFTETTPLAPSVITPTDGHACWIGGIGNYQTSGCEHFGVAITGNPTKTVYRWLVADPTKPGQLMPSSTKVSIPAPAWNIVPPPVAGPPVVQAILPAEPPEVEGQYGNAMWVKVFVTESPNAAELDHLVTDDPAVPQEASETEIEWAILQAGPNGAVNSELASEGQIGAGNESVTRRYEFYEYTGAYDPESHEVMCGGDGGCDQPLPGELGNYLGAQIAAINLALALAATLPNGEVGVLYNAPLATGGTAPYTIDVLKGEVPAGLSIDSSNGRLSGNPVAAVNSGRFTVQITDQVGATVTAAFKLKIVKAVDIRTSTLRSGKNGKAYRATVKASLGKAPYTWALIGGSLPAGLGLDAVAGMVSGVPTATGSFDLTLQVTDSLGGKDQKSFTLAINY